ncbi:hypothetical protein [Rhizosaccharibacter radicis]|uniref:Uncharacterized protein n=1 Tax=Rhizosaccharibacter radicis TaxID=2782605 RepID=A0ABT1VTA5_9PROT|nr:hypothetical protein [Acetobacteraceae bacterium KSS12]
MAGDVLHHDDDLVDHQIDGDDEPGGALVAPAGTGAELTGGGGDAGDLSGAQLLTVGAGDGDVAPAVVEDRQHQGGRRAESADGNVLAVKEPWYGNGILMVAGDGAGIPPQSREFVFDRFTRLTQAAGRGKATSGEAPRA